MTSPVIEKGMAAHLKGRNLFLNVMPHAVVERLKIRRKALASDAGLDESYDVGTYPPGPETVSINKGMSPVAAMVLSTAMLATGGGGALGAAKMLGLFDNKTQVQQVEQVLQEQEFDITIEEPGHGRPLKLETRPVP